MCVSNGQFEQYLPMNANAKNSSAALCYLEYAEAEFAQKHVGTMRRFDICVTSMAAPVSEFLDGCRSSSEGVTER